MKSRTKQVFLIIAMQTVCLGVGLWMQYHYVVAAVMRAATQRCYTNLEASASVLFGQPGGSAFTSIGSDQPRNEQLTQLLDAARPIQGELMVVDANWKPSFSSSRRHGLGDGDSVALRWHPDSRQVERQTEWTRGHLTFGDGKDFAVVRALPEQRGYVVLHHSAAEVEASAASLVADLPAISGLTLVWMFILLSIAIYMLWARLHDDMEEQRSRSATESLRQLQDLVRTRDAVIFGLAKLADSRDPETGDHLERISVYSTLLTAAAARDPKFRGSITPTFVRLIGISSALHDIGKVGIADSVLLKPGRLTPDEFKTMQEHARIGSDCLKEIERRLGSSNFLQMAREIALAHHENWDGSGYPRGLAGTNIPLAARIVAIADVYDALSSKRVYKNAFPHQECVRIIREDAGKKFDSDLVTVWLRIESRFRLIAQQLMNRASAEVDRTVVVSTGECGEQEFDEVCVATAEAPRAQGGV